MKKIIKIINIMLIILTTILMPFAAVMALNENSIVISYVFLFSLIVAFKSNVEAIRRIVKRKAVKNKQVTSLPNELDILNIDFYNTFKEILAKKQDSLKEKYSIDNLSFSIIQKKVKRYYYLSLKNIVSLDFDEVISVLQIENNNNIWEINLQFKDINETVVEDLRFLEEDIPKGLVNDIYQIYSNLTGLRFKLKYPKAVEEITPQDRSKYTMDIIYDI